jgi:hypothetical protein
MGQRKGASDLLLAGPPHGTLHALEIKKRGEHLTDEQEQFLKEVLAAGGKADWADSVDAALAILKMWGCLRQGIHI